MFEPVNNFVLDSTLEFFPEVIYTIYEEKRTLTPNDFNDPLHMHNYYEIFLNLSSDITMYIDEKYYPLTYGTPLVIKPRQLHVCEPHKIQRHEFFCLWIDVKSGSSLLSFLERSDLSPVYELEDTVQKTMINLFFELLDLKNKENYEIEKAVCFLNILKILKQCASTVTDSTEEPHQKLEQIVNHIQSNFSEIFNIKSVAEDYFISPSTLNRWFRKHLHTTPHEYLVSCKLKHAEALLLNGSSVTEAYLGAGFPDCSHFIALFRKKYGITPYQYKCASANKARK